MAARLEVDDFDKIVFLDSNDVVDVTRYVRSFNASNDKCSFSVSVRDFFKNGEFSTSQGAISVETKFFGESVNYNTRKRKMWVDCRSMSDETFGEYIDRINASYGERVA